MRKILKKLGIVGLFCAVFVVHAQETIISKDLLVNPTAFSPNDDGTDDVVTLQYTIDIPIDVSISVWDSANKYVRTLRSAKQEPGSYLAVWNGKNDEGKLLVPGIYTIKVDAGLTPVLDTTWGEGGMIKGYIDPKSLEIDSLGNIYVLDYGDGWLYKYSADGKKQEKIKELGRGHNCACVKVDDDSHIYIPATNSIVGVGVEKKIGYDERKPNGNGKLEPTERALHEPNAFAFGASNKIYIRNGSGHGLKVYDKTKEGVEGFLYSVPDKGYLFNSPGGSSLATDKRGNIWGIGACQITKLFDTGEGLILKYRTENKAEPDAGNLKGPMGLCYDRKACIYIADTGNNRIQKLYDDGHSLRFVWTFGCDGNIPAQGKFGPPVDVMIRGNDMYLLTKGENASLIKYTLKYSKSESVSATVKK